MVDLPDFPATPNPKMIEAQVKQAAQKLKEMEFQADQQQLKIDAQQEVAMNNAKIAEIYAKAEMELAQADAAGKGAIAALIDAQVGLLKQRNEGPMKLIELISKHQEKARGDTEKSGGAGVGGMETPPQDAGNASDAGGINLGDAGNMVN